MQSVYDDFQLLRTPPIGETSHQDVVLTNDRLSEQRSRGLLLTQAAQQDCRAPCYVVQFGTGRNKKRGTFY